MASEQKTELERRRMVGDVYGLKAYYQGGRCVDHLVRGDEVVIGPNARGETCVFCRGREYPMNFSLLYDVRQNSEPM